MIFERGDPKKDFCTICLVILTEKKNAQSLELEKIEMCSRN